MRHDGSVRHFCFTVPHYFGNFPFVGRPRYFSPVPVLAGEKYQTLKLRREYSWFSETFLFVIFIFITSYFGLN